MTPSKLLSPRIVDGVPEITPEELKQFVGRVTLIDVRRPDEFNGELSHIPSAQLFTLGPDLDASLKSHDKNDEIVFVCRSGGRSGQATVQSHNAGFAKGINLKGGMLLWNEKKLPVDRKS
jgi:rhodanese-related sulfurtransferase